MLSKASSIKTAVTHTSGKTMLTDMHAYAHFDQNIPCGSRVMSIFTRIDRRMGGTHSDYSVHMRVVQYHKESHKRTCHPSGYKQLYTCHVRIQRGDRGSGPHPLENHKNKGFLNSNTGPEPLKNHKATKPAFNVGPSSARQRNAVSLAGR